MEQLIVLKTKADLDSIIEQLEVATYIAYDTETTGLTKNDYIIVDIQ